MLRGRLTFVFLDASGEGFPVKQPSGAWRSLIYRPPFPVIP